MQDERLAIFVLLQNTVIDILLDPLLQALRLVLGQIRAHGEIRLGQVHRVLVIVSHRVLRSFHSNRTGTTARRIARNLSIIGKIMTFHAMYSIKFRTTPSTKSILLSILAERTPRDKRDLTLVTPQAMGSSPLRHARRNAGPEATEGEFMAYRIVTDSASNLVEEMIDEFGLEVLPLTFMVDGVEHRSYLKGAKTDLKQFYTMMREGKVITTSLPNMQETENTLRAILEQGDDVLYLGFSSALSGTYQATALLMEQLSEEYPERTLRAEETFAASGGQGMLVYLACKKAQEGATLDEVGDFVVQTRDHLCHWFTVDDLMFLFRGGRVSRTSAWAGTMLNIKPVLHVDSKGALVPMEKVRGRKKSIKALVDRHGENRHRSSVSNRLHHPRRLHRGCRTAQVGNSRTPRRHRFRRRTT